MWNVLHDRIISMRGGVWAQKHKLTMQHFSIEVPELLQESERSCICVLRKVWRYQRSNQKRISKYIRVPILHLSTIFLLHFRTDPTV